jgi:hypothetical protein
MALRFNLRIVFISAFMILVACTSYGQTNINISGKIYTIPKFSDDVLTLKERYVKEDSLLIVHKFIQPLAQSKYEFEARCFVKTIDIGNRFIMIILKGNKHKLSAELFDCRYVAILADGTPGIKLEKYVSIWIQNDQHRVNLKTDTNFIKLIQLGLFDYPDKKYFKGGKDLPTMERASESDFVVEIKLNEKYHSFRYYPGLLTIDPGNKKLINGTAMINAFFDIANCRRLM